MTIRSQIELETIPFVLIAAMVSAFLVWNNNQNFQKQFRATVPIVAGNETDNVVSPTVNPVLNVETASQISPDGAKMLFMQASHNKDRTTQYVFTTADASGENKQIIYTTVKNESETFAIPFNAWSPDDIYVFIQKNGNGALVFRASGEPIASREASIDVYDVFREKGVQNTMQKVTGWASPTLLIVNTKTPDGADGPSYWLEVPSKAVIQLSSRF